MEIIILAVSLLAVSGFQAYFMVRQMNEIKERDRIIASMIKEDYRADPGVLNEMALDVDQDKGGEEADLIDPSEMTADDLQDLT